MTDEKHFRDDRLDVRWHATIELNDVDTACLVDNISTAGARVEIETELEMGQELIIKIPELGEFAGEVAWQKPPFYGLKLVAGPDLDLKGHADEIGLNH